MQRHRRKRKYHVLTCNSVALFMTFQQFQLDREERWETYGMKARKLRRESSEQVMAPQAKKTRLH